jgi:ubiquinone/menaquinone biosynthesis C-methylase UbiE
MSGSTLFGGDRIARAYAEDRPYFHPHVMEMIRRFLGPEQSAGRALDAGCGAGLSARALRGIAASVAAVDVSLPMLRVARESLGPVCVAAAGESLPFRGGVFDLITAAGVVDWIDRSRFLPEARRVLRPGG